MSNNRLWLVHRPSGEAVCIGKRAGWGWEQPVTAERMQIFYDACIEKSGGDNQDDFVLAVEDNEAGNDRMVTDWTYDTSDGLKPVLTEPAPSKPE